ncbi:hypothetical protein SAMN04515647_1873 [Cohaesibacter sp. ES.047]|nr:hypothetical protein SAMN04515647_1873 [Cohaesibacter sp. ES.047]
MEQNRHTSHRTSPNLLRPAPGLAQRLSEAPVASREYRLTWTHGGLGPFYVSSLVVFRINRVDCSHIPG